MNKIIIILAMAGAFSQFESLATGNWYNTFGLSDGDIYSCCNQLDEHQTKEVMQGLDPKLSELPSEQPKPKTPANTESRRVHVPKSQRVHEVHKDSRNVVTSERCMLRKEPNKPWTEEDKWRLAETAKNNKHISCSDKITIVWNDVAPYFPNRSPKAVKAYFWQCMEKDELFSQFVDIENYEKQCSKKNITQNVVLPVSVYKKEQVVAQKVAVMKPVVNVKSLDDIVKQDQEADQEAYFFKLMTDYMYEQY